jgi:hypothetical protein
MDKFNLIVLSLLFILSVTAAAPVEPEQGIVKRDGICADNQGHRVCDLVSIDFIYARRLEPTEPLAASLPGSLSLNANSIIPVARRWRNYLLPK